VNTRVIDTVIVAIAERGSLLYAPRKTKSTAAISTAEQKIPIPAVTHPCCDFRALASGASGITIRFELMYLNVIAWCYSSFNTTPRSAKMSEHSRD